MDRRNVIAASLALPWAALARAETGPPTKIIFAWAHSGGHGCGRSESRARFQHRILAADRQGDRLQGRESAGVATSPAHLLNLRSGVFAASRSMRSGTSARWFKTWPPSARARSTRVGGAASSRPGTRRRWLLHAQAFASDLVSVASGRQPAGSDHLQPRLHTANRTTAARVVELAGSSNEVSV